MRIRLRQIAPVVWALALIVIAADLVLQIVTQHWFANLIAGAIPNSADKTTFKSIVTGVGNITNSLQGFAIGATPLAVAAGGLSWSFGHRRGVGMSVAALAGLAMCLAAPTIAS
jgi:hypothetical protein